MSQSVSQSPSLLISSFSSGELILPTESTESFLNTQQTIAMSITTLLGMKWGFMYETKSPADVFGNFSSVIFLITCTNWELFLPLTQNRTYPMIWTFEYLKLKFEMFHNSLQFQLKSFRDLVQASYSVFAQHLTVSTYYCMPYVWLDFPATQWEMYYYHPYVRDDKTEAQGGYPAQDHNESRRWRPRPTDSKSHVLFSLLPCCLPLKCPPQPHTPKSLQKRLAQILVSFFTHG